MSDINLGEKINHFRTLKKLTIKDLAEMTGLTPSMLSQIERNLTNPSVNTLKKISNSLDVPIFQFFQEDANADFIVHADSRKTIGFPENRDINYELLTPDTSGNIEFCLMTVPPFYNPENYMVHHKGEEVAYVQSGPIDILISNDRFTLYTGDSIRIPPFANHMWVNRTDKDVTIIFAITPPTF